MWFSSSRNQTTESSISSDDTKKASVLLIRKIYVLMQNLEPLPNDVCLTMKLFYYDEGTICNTSCFSCYLYVLLLLKLLFFIPNVFKGITYYIFFEITKFTFNINIWRRKIWKKWVLKIYTKHLGRVVQLVGASSCAPKSHGFDS